MKSIKPAISAEQKEFLKIKRYVEKRFPGAHTQAYIIGGIQYYRVLDKSNHAVVSPDLMLPPANTVTKAWQDAKYGSWFANMVRKSNNAFSDEKIYKKMANESKDFD